MTEDAWCRSIEERLSRIETFLDAELRQRQHFAELNPIGGQGPINPWYGCASGIVVQPIGVSPIAAECALGRAQSGVGDVAQRAAVTKADPVEDMLPECGRSRAK